MFCSKCGANISENTNFCGNCGNSLKQPSSKKKSKIIVVCIILVVCLIVGILLTPIVLNKIQQKKITEMVNILSSGYWMAMSSENNMNLTEYDYYNDFGLIFYPEMHYDGMHDSDTGLAVTTDGQVLEYVINPFNEIYCCTLYYNTESSSFSSFLIDYDEVNDVLAVTIVTEFLDIYNFFDANIEEDIVIYLSHFRGNDKNTELEKKLYFECWSTVDGDYSGTENKVKTDMFNEYPDADVIRFFKTGTRQFNYADINCFRWNYSEVGFVYTPTTFEISDEYKHNGVKMIGYSFNDSYYDYLRYDEKNNYLVSDATGNKLYCITNYEKTLQDYYDSKTVWMYEN